jgi:prolyl oligopeptidase
MTPPFASDKLSRMKTTRFGTSALTILMCVIAGIAPDAWANQNQESKVQEMARLPQTTVKEVKETLHGVELIDPYRWLEGDDNGKLTPDVDRWTIAQNDYTRSILDNLPARSKLEERTRQLLEVPSISAPSMRRNRYFYTKREGSQAQSVLYVREGHDGKPRVLIDPNTLDKTGLVTLSWHTANETADLLAFGLYRAGDENSVCHVLDVNTGQWRADVIEGKVGSVFWLPDSTGFFYRRLADVNNPYSGQIKFHRLGQHPDQDVLLFEQYKEGPLATTWGPSHYVSRDARWMILSYSTSTKANDLWCIDLDRWQRSGEFVMTEIVRGADARSGGPVFGDTLYMQTTLDAPNGRIVAVDLNRPSKDHWKEIVPQREDAVLEDVSVARGMLALEYQSKAYSSIELAHLDGKPIRKLELPGIGSANLSVREDRTEAFLTFTSFNYPTTIFRLDLTGGEPVVWERPSVPVDPSIVEVKQVFYNSKDGTRVSMFLVHPQGMSLDGNNPTILYGYGGFGIPMSPSFRASYFPWFEAGGVLAIPNLRGGSEYGDKWHAAGMLDRKQNVFDDFIAAAEWLVQNKYTNPKKLAISGGSNGGLLVGATAVQRPDLFAAVVCDVPLLDMIRYQNFLMARYWVPEYGSSEDVKQFQYLLKYSPYQNVRPGVKYPAMLLTAGENDKRVHPLHARKMAARLQTVTASDPKEDPILLWVEREAGHGAGKPLHLRLREMVDEQIFLMWQLGATK